MCINVLLLCINPAHVQLLPEEFRKIHLSLELDLWMVVSHDVGPGNQTLTLCKPTSDPSLLLRDRSGFFNIQLSAFSYQLLKIHCNYIPTKQKNQV